MWTDAKRDGRPAAKSCVVLYWQTYCTALQSAMYIQSLYMALSAERRSLLMPTAHVPCSKSANIRERKTWTQSEFCMHLAEFS